MSSRNARVRYNRRDRRLAKQRDYKREPRRANIAAHGPSGTHGIAKAAREKRQQLAKFRPHEPATFTLADVWPDNE